MKLILIALLLFVAQTMGFNDPTMILIENAYSSECKLDSDDVNMRQLERGDHVQASMLSKSKGFNLQINRDYKSMDFFILDFENYLLYARGRSLNLVQYAATSFGVCANTYIQMEEENDWFIVGECTDDDGCEVAMRVSDSSCSSRGKDSCKDEWSCGWCTNMAHTGEDECVPGKAFESRFDIHCDKFENSLGGLLILLLICCCCCCCCACGIGMQKRRKSRGTIHRRGNPNAQQMNAEAMYQQPHSIILATPIPQNSQQPQQQSKEPIMATMI